MYLLCSFYIAKHFCCYCYMGKVSVTSDQAPILQREPLPEYWTLSISCSCLVISCHNVFKPCVSTTILRSIASSTALLSVLPCHCWCLWLWPLLFFSWLPFLDYRFGFVDHWIVFSIFCLKSVTWLGAVIIVWTWITDHWIKTRIWNPLGLPLPYS